MTVRLSGPRTWSMVRDAEGHRTYKLKSLVECDPDDGPASALECPGLPVMRSYWNIGHDIDVWAWCLASASVNPLAKDEPNTQFEVEQEFSTKPPDNKKSRCQDQKIEDPLLELPKISGSFVKYTEEAAYDRFGAAILSSSFEMLRGKQVEFDANRPSVKIEQNVASALQGYVLPSQMVDCVNAYPLWGFPARCIKLSNAPWERKYYGFCEVYYSRTLEFDVSVVKEPTTGQYISGFDRSLLDEGSKVLSGRWDQATGHYVLIPIGGAPPDFTDPSHFMRFKDRNAEVCRVILDGFGQPAGTIIGTGSGVETSVGSIRVEKYDEADFLLLGIPTVF